MKRFAFVIMSFLTIVGCTSVGVFTIKPEPIQTSHKQIEGSIGTIQISEEKSYISVDGFSERSYYAIKNLHFKDENGITLIEAWKKALLSSIAESHFFTNSDGLKYDIKILIKEITYPTLVGRFPLTIKAEYKMIKMDKIIFATNISSTGRSDKHYFVGVKRLSKAYQNAVRINIELFINELKKNSDKF